MRPLIRSILANWPIKLLGGALLTFLFCAGYFGIQRHAIFPATRFTPTGVDRAIAFSPAWAWAYQSVYPLMLLAWLIERTDDLRRYFSGFVIVSLIGFTCFSLWPIEMPRPTAGVPSGMYGLLIRYDGPTNCFPSLHLALATFTACAVVVATDGRLRGLLRWILPIWIALIGFATLATKQHYFVDLPAGIVLGWSVQRLIWSTSHGELPRGIRQISEGSGG